LASIAVSFIILPHGRALVRLFAIPLFVLFRTLPLRTILIFIKTNGTISNYYHCITGHLDGFSDPMVDCTETKLRYCTDQLFASPIVLTETAKTIGWVCVQEANDADMAKDAKKMAKRMMKSIEHKGNAIEA